MRTAPKIALALVCAAGAAGLALPGQAQPQQSHECFLRRDIQNHTVGDDHTLYFEVSGRGVYRAVMSNACLAGEVSSDPIVMEDRTGSGRICRKMDLDVKTARGTRCIVDHYELMTPQEVAALPRRQRP
jgi:hypothetical protein